MICQDYVVTGLDNSGRVLQLRNRISTHSVLTIKMRNDESRKVALAYHRPPFLIHRLLSELTYQTPILECAARGEE